jgi:uncharacterized FlaG/YvyC family protein
MLETKIDKLTSAIERLIKTLDTAQLAFDFDKAASAASAATVSKTETVQSEPKPAAPTVTVDSLQTRCLELTRADKGNSPKIKTIIASYGGKLVKDIPAESLEEFASKLEELA